MSWQQWIGEGRLGNDCEMKYTPNGKAVSSFSLAIDNGVGDKKTTLWFRVNAWEKQAELISDLKKGAHVLVVGRVEQSRTFQDKSGNQRVSMEITASTVRFLDKRGADTSAHAGGNDEESQEIPF
jgi:single-strand DNA-binding protein